MQWSSCTHQGIKVSRITSGTAGQRRSGARLRGSWPYGCNWPAHSAGDHTGLTPRYQRAALTPPQPDWVANPARQHIGAYFATTGIRRISRGDIRHFAFALVGDSSRDGEFPAGGSLLRGVATTLARSTGAPPTARLALDLPAAGLGQQHKPDPIKGDESVPGDLHQGPITPAKMRATTYVGMILPETGTGIPKIAAPSFKVARRWAHGWSPVPGVSRAGAVFHPSCSLGSTGVGRYCPLGAPVAACLTVIRDNREISRPRFPLLAVTRDQS